MEQEKYIGYLKYTGESVKDGLLDTRKTAEALLGLDDILRYFISKEDSELISIDYEIPVRIRKGSWEALIPVLMVAWFAKDYLSATAKKAGTDGFLETGIVKDFEKIIKSGLKSAQWVIKIAKHLGAFSTKTKTNLKYTNNNTEIGIPNTNGEYLYVPIKYWDIFAECPEIIFSKNTLLIEQERILQIGIIENGEPHEVSINSSEKHIFCSENDEDEDILFPELRHGQHVELKGNITRLNIKTNTLGFEYEGHILTCKPEINDLSTFKNKIVSQRIEHIFPNVKIIGSVDRTDKNGSFKEKRPMIIFTDIVQIESKEENGNLFD